MTMYRIAMALEQGNPFAYLLLVMLVLPPVFIIICGIIDKVREHADNRHEK